MIEHYLYPLVCERFKNNARYREGHLRVINALPERKVLGLHTPEMKRVAKEISLNGAIVKLPGGKELVCCSGQEVIRCFEQVPSESLFYEETVIWGLLVNCGKYTVDERLEMLSRYVPIMDNWAVCDAYCANAKWMLKVDKEFLWRFLQPWFASHREFEARFAIVASMCCFLQEEWLDRVFERIDMLSFNDIVSEYRTIKGKPLKVQEGCVQGVSPYYVRMGVAWLLATALAKFPERTRLFVRSSRLPADVVRLYLRKARESFRTHAVTAL